MTHNLCDKWLIGVVAVVTLSCVVAASILAYRGHPEAMAALVALAGQALGILSPSALKQQQGGSPVDAGPGGNVVVNNPPAEPAETIDTPG